MNIYYALFFIFTYAVAIDLEDITNVSVNIPNHPIV